MEAMIDRGATSPKLVLLPGLDGTGKLFAGFIAALPAPLKVLTLSYPTERNLTYTQLERLVDAACETCGPFVLLAESFSTPLAIKYAATNPPGLIGLVLCAGFATSPIKGWRQVLGSLFAPLVFRIPLPNFAIRQWLIGWGAPSSLLNQVRSAVSSLRTDVLVERFKSVLACEARFELSQIAVPILYIQATRDRLVKASSLWDILAVRPEIQVSSIDGPHLLLQRRSKRAAEVVVLFIQSCDHAKTF